MKKLLYALVLSSALCNIALWNHISQKYSNINYVVNRYFTYGILNKYKMYQITDNNLYFSNGKVAFVKVKGISEKPNYPEVQYNVFMKKTDQGLWEIYKVYLN